MIRLLISDFDGTLVDTFEANFKAYEKAFDEAGVAFSRQDYRRCFGFRFDRLMEEMKVSDKEVVASIREAKARYYPDYFKHVRINEALVYLLLTFRDFGCKTALASTARRKNLMNVLEYVNLTDVFDLIIAGEDVQSGKPSPEIYMKAMSVLNVSPYETLVFEDSEVGLLAAKAAGARCVKIIM